MANGFPSSLLLGVGSGDCLGFCHSLLRHCCSKTAVIYLRWTATGYDLIRPGYCHSTIGGNGQVQRLHVYVVDLLAHTKWLQPQQHCFLQRLHGRYPRPLDPDAYPQLSTPASARKPQRLPADGAGSTFNR